MIRLDIWFTDAYSVRVFTNEMPGMNKYLLVKLVQWAGKLRTRKAMQKMVFLLKAKGFPFRADYRLHHFGPYSPDVAEAADDLVQRGLLVEEHVGSSTSHQYNYCLAPQTEEKLAQIEQTASGASMAAEIGPFEPLARRLLAKDVRELEVASTVAYFWLRHNDWDKAVAEACAFKHLNRGDPLVARSSGIAKEAAASQQHRSP